MNHFDSKAAEWDDNPVRVENARKIAAAIRAAVPLNKTMRALEFGCGTGLISRELFPTIGNILAIDLSSGMIAQLQNRIDEAELKNISARCLDIFTDPPDGPFDLIFSAMAMHHVQNTDALLDRFAALTAPGGWIALADLDTEDGTFHDHFEGFIHHGLDRNELMKKLRVRGFSQTAAITAHTMHKNGRDYPVFLLTARKPAE
ncbi:MAG: class I SAM-dependent methyltransferase [Kiritimatiellales bacterium]|nr:class I SAM-dependent methyltransferase [Kiritimatiellales bacterium]